MPDQASEKGEMDRLHRVLAGSLGVISWTAENPETRTILTLPADQLVLGHPTTLWSSNPGLWFSHVHEHDRSLVRETIESTKNGSGPKQYEYRFLGRDGTIFWMRDFVERTSPEGNPAQYSGLTLNITNHKLSDLQLGVFDPLIRAVYESSDVTAMFERVIEHICKSTGWVLGQVWIPETETTFLCIAGWSIEDRALARFMAHSRETKPRIHLGFIGTAFTMGNPLWTREPTRDLQYERGRTADDARLQAGVAIPVLSDDRTVAVIEFYMTERRAEDPLLVEVISAATAHLGTVLHRRLTESLRGNTSALLRAILQHSPNMIFIKDLDGRYLEVNESFLREFRLTRPEVIGQTDLEIFPKEQAESFRENDRKVVSNGVEMEFEETAVHANGTHISIVHKFPLKDEHGICYALGGIVTDITGRTSGNSWRKPK